MKKNELLEKIERLEKENAEMRRVLWLVYEFDKDWRIRKDVEFILFKMSEEANK